MISSENKTVKLLSSSSSSSSKNYNLSRIKNNRRKQQSIMLCSPTVTITCQKLLYPESRQEIILPDLILDIVNEQKRQSSIQNVAEMLRKVGDELDDRLNKTSSSSSSSSFSIQIVQYESLILQYVIPFTRFLRLFL
ncbi:unnamed protein product [Didymodactylos carnosus]|uniref:Uncharacterized protein n=1 Tax=Didymodactylos carnosus TaxID=1234261 RepID=A0A814CX00_9BILA|nr:unnamed protein product [Didymodactylos carnosus]CAF1214102.1 unnamed protein product [Didymodactylos carnosus]CAF3722622.1 unnamed protein product [Didymodactylos carnosus]CAF4022747.1 unnamed protein product [Didymodactylos carnosus]